jgi:hypothetical protein
VLHPLKALRDPYSDKASTGKQNQMKGRNTDKTADPYLGGDQGASRILREAFQDCVCADERQRIWKLDLEPSQNSFAGV